MCSSNCIYTLGTISSPPPPLPKKLALEWWKACAAFSVAPKQHSVIIGYIFAPKRRRPVVLMVNKPLPPRLHRRMRLPWKEAFARLYFWPRDADLLAQNSADFKPTFRLSDQLWHFLAIKMQYPPRISLIWAVLLDFDDEQQLRDVNYTFLLHYWMFNYTKLVNHQVL